MTNHNGGGPDVCDVCDQPHATTLDEPSCVGHNPCRRHPTRGPHCTAHARYGAELLGPIVVRPVRDPLERLSTLAGRLEAWLEVAEDRLARVVSFGDGEGRLRAEVKAFNALASRLAYLLSLMARLDLDERLMRLDRVQANQLREVLEMVMRDPELGLSDVQQAEWPRAFARGARLQVGAAGPAAIESDVA